MTVLRYIHQNPIKAGIETNISKYPWSSYNEYLGKENICDIKFALDFFADEKKRAVDLFKKFNSEENDDKCFEYEKDGRIDDIEAAKLIEKTAKVENPNQVQNCEKEKRDKIIKELKNGGLSIRQIERLTGISFAVIRRI